MDKLDHLLTLYTGRCVEDEAKYFLSLDVTGIEYNEKIKKRMLRYAFKRSRYEQKRYVAKLILAACLIAMSVVFTACMSISEIRDAIWGIVVEWFDDYIEVQFDDTQSGNADSNIRARSGPTDAADEGTTVSPPETIEQIAYASYLPEGYTAGEPIVTPEYVIIKYFNAKGDYAFSIAQAVKNAEGWLLNNGDIETTQVYIHSYPAILTDNTENGTDTSITWKAEKYLYHLYGTFPSLSELILIAESISLQ